MGEVTFGEAKLVERIDKKTNKTEMVVIKILRTPNTKNDSFEREFSMLSKLKHPNIVTLLGSTKVKSDFNSFHRGIVMEYMEGGSLKDGKFDEFNKSFLNKTFFPSYLRRSN